MKVSQLLALATLAASASMAAHATTDAQDPAQFSQGPVASSKTRQQVQAELFQFQQASANPWSTRYDALRAAPTGRDRAEVRAEFLQSRAETAAMTGEDSGSAYLAKAPSAQDADRTLAGTPQRSAE